MTSLVLSLFPGIGLLDRGFEDEGFCVVRGPDLLWGGDVKKFHAPAGRFDGVIGGPPCQAFSSLRHLVRATGGKIAENLIPEYERLCGEVLPTWFVMENVPDAPEPIVPGYQVRSLLLNNRWCADPPEGTTGAEQNRERRFSFGTRDGLTLKPHVALFEHPRKTLAVMATGGGVRSPLQSAEAASGNGGCFQSTLEPVPAPVTSKIGQEKSIGGCKVRAVCPSVAENGDACERTADHVGDHFATISTGRHIWSEPTTLLAPIPGTVVANPGRSFTTHHPDDEGGRRENGTSVLAPLQAVLASAGGDSHGDDVNGGRIRKWPTGMRGEAYFREACRLQGLPADFDLPPFTVSAKIKAVGNGVPYPLARAVARAVREAMEGVRS